MSWNDEMLAMERMRREQAERAARMKLAQAGDVEDEQTYSKPKQIASIKPKPRQITNVKPVVQKSNNSAKRTSKSSGNIYQFDGNIAGTRSEIRPAIVRDKANTSKKSIVPPMYQFDGNIGGTQSEIRPAIKKSPITSYVFNKEDKSPEFQFDMPSLLSGNPKLNALDSKDNYTDLKDKWMLSANEPSKPDDLTMVVPWQSKQTDKINTFLYNSLVPYGVQMQKYEGNNEQAKEILNKKLQEFYEGFMSDEMRDKQEEFNKKALPKLENNDNIKASEHSESDLLQMANLADASYNCKKSDTFSGGWVTEVVIDEHGLRMAIFKRQDSDGKTEYVIANAGTELFSSSDWENNIKQPLGLSPHMRKSIYHAKSFIRKHPHTKVTFVGHSKGGAEAAVNAVATNKDAILFNPSRPNFKAYNVNPLKYDGNITTFGVQGEILNDIFGYTPIGKIYQLNTKYKKFPSGSGKNVLVNALANAALGKAVGKVKNAYNAYQATQNHMMSTVIDGLKEWEETDEGKGWKEMLEKEKKYKKYIENNREKIKL